MSLSNKQENENYKIARASSDKFEFYFIALVFTILGLSIQTSSMIEEYYQYIFEISSWGFLLISGLIGLSRLEWMGVFYRQHGALQEAKKTADMLLQGIKGTPVLKSRNESWTKGELQDKSLKHEKLVMEREKEIKKISEGTQLKYEIHKWAFRVGITALVISRVIVGLYNMFYG